MRSDYDYMAYMQQGGGCVCIFTTENMQMARHEGGCVFYIYIVAY